jgi:hypothetical protein
MFALLTQDNAKTLVPNALLTLHAAVEMAEAQLLVAVKTTQRLAVLLPPPHGVNAAVVALATALSAPHHTLAARCAAARALPFFSPKHHDAAAAPAPYPAQDIMLVALPALLRTAGSAQAAPLLRVAALHALAALPAVAAYEAVDIGGGASTTLLELVVELEGGAALGGVAAAAGKLMSVIYRDIGELPLA